MSRGLKTLLTVFVCLGVLATAVFLPMLIMNKSSGFNTKSYPGADLTVSSQGIEKAEFFAKTLKYPDAFKTIAQYRSQAKFFTSDLEIGLHSQGSHNMYRFAIMKI